MQRELEGRDARAVRLHTRHGTLEGRLHTNPGVSTMHYLNVVATSQNFVTLYPPLHGDSHWTLEDAPVAIAASAILFVVELSAYDPKPGDPQEAARFQRAAVRLQVAEHQLEGFVHVPPGGDPIARLNLDRHPFVALTSASVLGPDSEFAAPFVAVSRRFVLAVQPLGQPGSADRERAVETDVEA